MEYVDVPGFEEQLMNKALLEARKIAREKPLGDLIDDESRAAYKRELAHLSKDELLEKMLAAYLRS
jgi:ATP-dependent RNA helicase DeaD